MNKDKSNYIWEDRLRHHMSEEMKGEVLELYRDCFGYSPYKEHDKIMAFVTKCFIERNKQLKEKANIVQVKMKWGILTIYYDGCHDPYLNEIVNTANEMAKTVSRKITETYGKGGPWNRKILQPIKSK